MKWEIQTTAEKDGEWPEPDGEKTWEPFGFGNGLVYWRSCKWEHRDVEGNEGNMAKLLMSMAEHVMNEADEICGPARDALEQMAKRVAQLEAEAGEHLAEIATLNARVKQLGSEVENADDARAVATKKSGRVDVVERQAGALREQVNALERERDKLRADCARAEQRGYSRGYQSGLKRRARNEEPAPTLPPAVGLPPPVVTAIEPANSCATEIQPEPVAPAAEQREPVPYVSPF